jgi:hypothetical protein
VPASLTFKTAKSDIIVTKSYKSQTCNIFFHTVNLQKDERAAECHCLVAPPSIQPTVPLGMYTIHWRRKEHNNILPFVSTTLTLPTIPVEHVPLFVDAQLPSHGSVRVCLPAVYTIYNRTGYVQEMEVNMENSECFMFSGHKHVSVCCFH